MNLKIIRDKIIKGEYDLSEHAHKERQDERISVKEIEQTVLNGDIIEKYPKDPRGESCLITCETFDNPIHVVCGFRNKRLLIVTLYRPTLPKWVGYKTRAKELKSRV